MENGSKCIDSILKQWKDKKKFNSLHVILNSPFLIYISDIILGGEADTLEREVGNLGGEVPTAPLPLDETLEESNIRETQLKSYTSRMTSISTSTDMSSTGTSTDMSTRTSTDPSTGTCTDTELSSSQN